MSFMEKKNHEEAKDNQGLDDWTKTVYYWRRCVEDLKYIKYTVKSDSIQGSSHGIHAINLFIYQMFIAYFTRARPDSRH